MECKPFAPSRLTGKVVILSFWATWCGPCLLELPLLNKLAASLPPEKATIVTICTDGLKNSDKVNEILSQGNYQLPVLMASGSLLESFQIAAIPTLFIIRPNGIIHKVLIGYDPDMERIVTRAIKELAAK